MASSFTINQPFIGAPLHFQPPLGSPELERLIDAYVPGSARKQDKISDVTIDFYTTATFDLDTGAFFKRYDVYLPNVASNSFEQSPTYSQSSIFTPSPGSSMTLGDSGYGSISMTPPNRVRDARITKKLKNDTKKTAELRLPGFSIMTRDGIDVTSSAGRGTKTKEQREHAHLMRILKACDDCKRKKIRCNPSHRRAHNDMSRTSTSTSNASSSRRDPEAPTFAPSLSRETTHRSQECIPPFFPSSAIDDFVLFPDDDVSWDTAGISIPEFESQNFDFSEFDSDFASSDFNNQPPVSPHQSFQFPSSLPQQDLQRQTQYEGSPFQAQQHSLDQWAAQDKYSIAILQTDIDYSHSQFPASISASPQSGVGSSISSMSPQSSISPFVENACQHSFFARPEYALQSSASESHSPLGWILDASDSPQSAGLGNSQSSLASHMQIHISGLRQQSLRPILDEHDRLGALLEQEQNSSSSASPVASHLINSRLEQNTRRQVIQDSGRHEQHVLDQLQRNSSSATSLHASHIPRPEQSTWRQEQYDLARHTQRTPEQVQEIFYYAAAQPNRSRSRTEDSSTVPLQPLHSTTQRTILTISGVQSTLPGDSRRIESLLRGRAQRSPALIKSVSQPQPTQTSKALQSLQEGVYTIKSRSLAAGTSANDEQKQPLALAMTLVTVLTAVMLTFLPETTLTAVHGTARTASVTDAQASVAMSRLAFLCLVVVIPPSTVLRCCMDTFTSLFAMVKISTSAPRPMDSQWQVPRTRYVSNLHRKTDLTPAFAHVVPGILGLRVS